MTCENRIVEDINGTPVLIPSTKEIKQKPGGDFAAGLEWRRGAIAIWQLMRYGICLDFIHEYLRLMTPAEKRIKNTIVNRIMKVGVEDAMGLDMMVSAPHLSIKTHHISLRRFKDVQIYYKAPGNVVTQERFVEEILPEICFIFTDPPKCQHYNFAMAKELRWIFSTSKGNTNRIYCCNRDGSTINPAGFEKIPISTGKTGFVKSFPSLPEFFRGLLS